MHLVLANEVLKWSSVKLSPLELNIHSMAMGEFPKLADVATFAKL